jgi:hypothetical protein
MIGWVAVLAFLAGGIALWFGGRAYGRIFSDDHFIEMGRAIDELKKAAIDQPITSGDVPKPGDPRVYVTSVGIVLMYTIHIGKNEVTHHCSASVAGALTTHSLGSTLIAYVVGLLGFPFEHTRFAWSAASVHHAEATLQPSEHEAFAASPVRAVSRANVAALRRAALEARSKMKWQSTSATAS